MIERWQLHRYQAGKLEEADDLLASEQEVELWVNGKRLLAAPCSPGMREELAWGCLLSLGLIEGRDQVLSLRAGGGRIEVEIGAGRARPRALADFSLPAARLIQAGNLLSRLGEVFRKTGGTHVAALFPEAGPPFSAEDVSRHCALDKAIGAAFSAGIELDRAFLVTSSRLSARLVGKIARAGIPLAASLSAPTAQAAQLAEELGLTLCGFLRGARFNVYSHPERIEP